MMDTRQMTVQLIRQEEVYHLSLSLVLQLNESGFQPDLIVAVARGGLVPARYICDFLDLDMLVAVKIKHYDAGSVKRNSASLEYPLSIDVTGKKVLLVDDVNDTGKTLRKAYEHIESKKPDELRSAVLHQKTTTGFQADFYEDELTEWRWITYPWACVEDLTEFAKPLMKRVETLADLQKLLQDRHDMNVRKEDIEILQKLGKIRIRQL